MIHGIGTDILSRARFGAPEADDPFIRRAYTDSERAEAASREDPARWFCARFAGKEAVFKALGLDPEAARLDEIEILSDGFGAPHVTLHGGMRDFALHAGIARIHLSLSWETDYALAFAVAEREEKGGVTRL